MDDDEKDLRFAALLLEQAEDFEKKSGCRPNLCITHPDSTRLDAVGSIEVRKDAMIERGRAYLLTNMPLTPMMPMEWDKEPADGR